MPCYVLAVVSVDTKAGTKANAAGLVDRYTDGWMDGWLGFNGILSTQVAAISCLRSLLVRPMACTKEIIRLE